MSDKESIPLEEGLWESDDSGINKLLGHRCRLCGELFFPRKKNGVCTYCQERDLETVKLSDYGRVVTFTVVYQRPAGGFYRGVVPYAYGVVELPEGIRFMTLLTSNDLESIEVGSKVRLVIDPLFEDDEGKQILTFKFEVVEE